MQDELTHAAMLWHAARTRRRAIGGLKRKLQSQLKAGGYGGWCLQLRFQEGEASRQLTEARRQELAAAKRLANACAKQRDRLDASDVIELDGAITLLTGGG